MSVETVPKDLKNLRACLVCSLIKEIMLLKEMGKTKGDSMDETTNRGVIKMKICQTADREKADWTMTQDQFEYDGCENCDEFLRMKNNRENVYDCTSSNFDGMIAVMSPEDSWVCKWQRINRFVKGVYAISVAGRLPQHIIRDMKNRGLVYRPRDTSQR